ncbi:poly(A) polymerase 2 [Striga asiatica]|uniref:Poly(A) polymerase 2 n=1 Tax=Striga asiatica TaxID=4170 RepID=A0A5A7RH80_STRAF|nr:poly(A) polymerase 2 [Striga asiatica]
MRFSAGGVAPSGVTAAGEVGDWWSRRVCTATGGVGWRCRCSRSAEEALYVYPAGLITVESSGFKSEYTYSSPLARLDEILHHFIVRFHSLTRLTFKRRKKKKRFENVIDFNH